MLREPRMGEPFDLVALVNEALAPSLVMVGRPPKCCLDNFISDTCWPATACPDEPCDRYAVLFSLEPDSEVCQI